MKHLPLKTLNTSSASLIIGETGAGRPYLYYLGSRIDTRSLSALDEAKAHGLFDLGETPGLFPLAGDGWTGTPVLDGLVSVKRIEPQAQDDRLTYSAELKNGGQLALKISIAGTGLRLQMGYQPNEPADTRVQPARIVLPLPRVMADFIRLDGRWSGELQPRRGRLETGTGSASSRAGNRHAHNGFPGLVIGEDGFTEDTGEVIGVHFGAIGDFMLRVEISRDGTPILVAEDLAPTTTKDQNGYLWSSELVLTCSDAGLNGLRKSVPGLRRALRGPQGERKVQLNTWEGVYFNHDLERLKDMARAGAALGAEHFVLDDGWFGRRTDDTRSLGDWTARRDTYPDGLSPLISYVADRGMSFGLWVEPEMVNSDSALFEQHPDWIVGDPDQPLGRNQYGLNLSNEACFEHLQTVMTEIAAMPGLSSLKWDCNRDLPGVSGDYVQRVEALMAHTLKQATESLWIEACASGGGRLTAGFSAVCARYWLSDTHDPDIKLPMLAQAALFFEHAELGTHVGAGRSHLTGRHFPVETRAAVAVMGHMGLELDPTSLNEHEQDVLKRAITYWKAQRDWACEAPLLQIPHPEPGLMASAIVSPVGDRAMLCVLQTRERQSAVPAPLRLKHLAGDLKLRTILSPPAAERRAKAQPAWLTEGADLPAAHLAKIGLPLPILAPGEALLIDISGQSRQTAE